MGDSIAGMILRIIEDVNENNTTASDAYRRFSWRYLNECKDIIEEKNQKLADKDDEFQKFVSKFIGLAREDDGSVELLNSHETDILMNAVTRETVQTVRHLLREEANRAEILRTIRLRIQLISIKEQRKLAYTMIWSHLPYNSLKHEFTNVSVKVGHDHIRIQLSNPKSRINIDYRSQVDECVLRCYNTNLLDEVIGHVIFEDVIQLDFNDLAANEFIEILKCSLPDTNCQPPVTLLSLKIDIELPTLDSPPYRYPNHSFFRKINSWIKEQPSNRHVSTFKFSYRFYKYGHSKDELFDLKFLQPGILDQIIIRSWDDRHLTEKRQFPVFIREWEKSEQWKKAKYLDICDPCFKEFHPRIDSFNIIRKAETKTRNILDYYYYFNQNRLPSNEIEIFTGYRRRGRLYKLDILMNSNLIMCLLRDERTNESRFHVIA